MESFYGGRSGASFVIKKRFDAISITETIYRKRYYAVSNGVPIVPLIERTGLNENDYDWDLFTLDGSSAGSGVNFPTETAEGMVQFFEQGAVTTSEVNYGEYVIIDTVSGLKDTQNIYNGQIFIRTPDINNGYGGAEYVGQITGITYVSDLQVTWDNVLNKPGSLVQDANYNHTDNNFTTTLKNKLDGIATGAEVNVQSDWDQSNNAADDYIKNKPVNLSDFNNDLDLIDDSVAGNAKTYSSNKIITLLADKVSTITGKGLSTNDYTTEEKNKLSGIAAGAEVNVQADWAQTDDTADDYIQNKPSLVQLDDVEVRADATFSSSRINNLISTLIVPITQQDYDDLPEKDPLVMYIIMREEE